MAKSPKYKKRMSELELTDANFNDNIRELIASYGNANAALASATDDGARAEIEADIESLDNEIVAALEKRKKGLETAKKMMAGKAAKRTGSSAPAQTPAPEKPATIAADGTKTEEAKDEKKGGGGFWAFVGFLAVGAAAVLGFKAYQNRA